MKTMLTRRNLHALSLMTVFATIIPVCAHTDSTPVVRKAIQAIYDRQNAAGSRLDSDGSLVGYAPDFVSIDAKGRRSDMAHERQTSRELFATIHAYVGTTTIQKITVTGSVATVRVIEHVATTLTNPNTNKAAHVVYEDTSTDTWKKSGKGWLLIRAQVLSEHGTMGW